MASYSMITPSLRIGRVILLALLSASPIAAALGGGSSGRAGFENLRNVDNDDGRKLSHASSFRSDISVDPGVPLPLWPNENDIPGERPGTIGNETIACNPPDVPIHNCNDRSVHNVAIPTLLPFLISSSDAAVIVAPGGGYSMLAIDKEGIDIAHWLNSIGISALVLKYRVPDRPWLPFFGAAPLMDAQRAMGMVRAMAGKQLPYLNPSKVGFMGFSAGGHLTGHLNVAWANRSYHLHNEDPSDALPCRPDFSIMIYPWRSVSQPPVNEPISGASALNVTNQTPPTLLIQTEDDLLLSGIETKGCTCLRAPYISARWSWLWQVYHHGTAPL